MNTYKKVFDDYYEVISVKRLYSDGTTNVDTSFYTGSGGIVYTYY